MINKGNTRFFNCCQCKAGTIRTQLGCSVVICQLATFQKNKQYTNLYRTRVYEAGYEDFFTPQKTNVSYPVAALNPAYEVITQKPHSGNYAPIPSDTKENQLCNLSPEQLTQCFSMTLAALDRTLDFINENTPTQLPRIDYINYLLGYFIFHNEVLTEDNKEKLLQWMDNVDFTNKSNSERRDIFTALIT